MKVLYSTFFTLIIAVTLTETCEEHNQPSPGRPLVEQSNWKKSRDDLEKEGESFHSERATKKVTWTRLRGPGKW